MKTVCSEDFSNFNWKSQQRGIGVLKCFTDLKELEIPETLEEIQNMPKMKFHNILKSRIRINALKYLKGKQKSKGGEISYPDIEMADYLLPSNDALTVENKQKLFSIRNRMIDIPSNFQKSDEKSLCFCGEQENMKHVFDCEILNEGKPISENYENVFNGNIGTQIRIFRQFEENLKKREIIINQKSNDSESNLPRDPSDPLFFVRVVMD